MYVCEVAPNHHHSPSLHKFKLGLIHVLKIIKLWLLSHIREHFMKLPIESQGVQKVLISKLLLAGVWKLDLGRVPTIPC